MEPKNLGDHQKLLTDVIKKQIVILGPDITLAKARNVQGLTVADDGTVTAINGDPKLLTQALINQFMELSGLIVKKTMEPLLALSADGNAAAASMAPIASAPVIPAIETPAPPPTTASPTEQNPIANINETVQQSNHAISDKQEVISKT